MTGTTRLRLIVKGTVQGVGFRPFVYRLAVDGHLDGWVCNSGDGVIIEIEGTPAQLQRFRERLSTELPALAEVRQIVTSEQPNVGATGFDIRDSETQTPTTLVAADAATCEDCRRELFDARNRRYRYPFINCTNCGPRYSIIEALPYDRPQTSMRRFEMCPACRAEYDDPGDRRFHAQPNACADCGPRLSFRDGDGDETGEAAFARAAALLRDGGILALKGLGGYQLIVDARNSQAVDELRRRKGRPAKPLALMYPSPAMVATDCLVDELAGRLLAGPAAPIVLLPRRQPARSQLAAAVAPDSPHLGIMLPSTPLHHLLLAELQRPIVATSGNLSNETICLDNAEAERRLGHIADGFLHHDRPIVRHCDDGIVMAVAGRPALVRCGRGLAPLSLPLPLPVPPVLAVGGHLKSTVGIGLGETAVLSQHVGDLDSSTARDAFSRTVDALQRLYDFHPQLVACDLHPDYASSQYARARGLPVVSVQHHYAHALACMAEHGLRGEVLAVVWDGSGWGPDQTVWGGEFLIIDDHGYRRFARFRTFPLPGGELAVREPRRSAAGMLYEIHGTRARIPGFTEGEQRLLIRMMECRTNSPRTSSVGRLFDGMAALCGLRLRNSFEGQAAMQLEHAATPGDDTAYPFCLAAADDGTLVVDWEPALAAILSALAGNAASGQLAWRFHCTLAQIMLEVAMLAGLPRVVLSGGCFQNRRLTEQAAAQLQNAGMTTYLPQRVPANDGGLALGQIIAAARSEGASCA